MIHELSPALARQGGPKYRASMLMPDILIGIRQVRGADVFMVRGNMEVYALGPLYALIVVATVLLWLRLRSVLDLWLMVVLCAFTIEITLSVYPNAARFTAGWYGSRVYALQYSSLLLSIMLIETTKLYGRLLQAILAQRREREVRQLAMDAMAAAIAHAVKQPLAAITNDGHAGLNFKGTPDLDEVRDCIESMISSARRASEVIDGIRSLYKKDIRERAWLDVNEVAGGYSRWSTPICEFTKYRFQPTWARGFLCGVLIDRNWKKCS